MKIHAARTMQFALNILHGHQNQRRKGEINGKSIFRILSQSTQFKAFRRHSLKSMNPSKEITYFRPWLLNWTKNSILPLSAPLQMGMKIPYCRQYLCKPAANCRASGEGGEKNVTSNWLKIERNPIRPVIVPNGRVQEEFITENIDIDFYP